MSNASEYVLKRSCIARQSRARTIELTNRAVELLRQTNLSDRGDLEKYLYSNLKKAGNPWAWLVLKILLPIIIRLVLDWYYE